MKMKVVGSNPGYLLKSFLLYYQLPFLGMDGQNCTPDGLQWFQRLTRKIISQLLADKNFDIFSLKDELEEKLEKFRNREEIPDFDIGSKEFDIEVPDIVMKTCEEEGCHWIAGTVFRIIVFHLRAGF